MIEAPVVGPRAAAPTLLVVRTDRLGETLLTLPLLEALRAARPGWHLAMLVHPALRELFEGHPAIDEVLAEPSLGSPWWRRAARLAQLWRSWRIETIVISNPKKEYHLAAWLAGIRRRIGYRQKWAGLLTRALPNQKPLGAHHELEYNLELLAAFDVPRPSTPTLRLPVSLSDDQRVGATLEGLFGHSPDRLVAVHPWTSDARKQWPAERFAELIARVRAGRDARVVLIGGEAERPRARALNLADTGVADLTGCLSLRESAALLRRACVLVSSDSGPAHLATAVGTPVVALFGAESGATGPTRWRPWGPGHTVITKPSMSSITVDEVFNAMRTRW